MYCKNCGAEHAEGAAICVKCGFAIGTGEHYCANCGVAVEPGQAFCVSCGSALNTTTAPAGSATTKKSSKSKLVAGLLAIFLGAYGVHNFYLGKTGRAVAQLLITVLTCFIGSIISGVWSLIEGIFILTSHEGYTTDAQGNPLND